MTARAEDSDTRDESREETRKKPLFRDNSQFPESLSEKAFCGLAGRIVRKIAPHSEAHPAAIMAATLTYFGNAISRGPYVFLGNFQHATNLFVAITGETSDGRKGTATESPLQLVCEADPAWAKRVASGLESGQGVIHHVRDAQWKKRKAKKDEEGADKDGLVEELADQGVADKRLMVNESEFEQVLAVNGRRNSTLSSVLRGAWDKGDLQTLSKNSPERATGALVSILTQITPLALQACLGSTEIANGFMNRFMIVAARRSQLLPRGGNVPAEVLSELANEVHEALNAARALKEIGMTDEAWGVWPELYTSLVSRPPGLVGDLTARAPQMVRRLAMLYALLDKRDRVDVEHLEAALEMWRYVEDSTRWVYGDQLGDEVLDACISALRQVGSFGLTRTELSDLFGHHVSAARITGALRRLEAWGLAYSRKEKTGGRPTERWFAVDTEEEEPDEDGTDEDPMFGSDENEGAEEDEEAPW